MPSTILEAPSETQLEYIPADFAEGEACCIQVLFLDLLYGANFHGGPCGDCWEIRPERVLGDDGYGKLDLKDAFLRWRGLVYESFGCPLRSAHKVSFKATHPGTNLDDLWKEDGKQGLHIHHMCENRRCFRPSHLRPVTPEENEKLKCCQEPRQRHTCGRYYDIFRFHPEGGSDGSKIVRLCSVCDRAKKTRYKRRRKGRPTLVDQHRKVCRDDISLYPCGSEADKALNPS